MFKTIITTFKDLFKKRELQAWEYLVLWFLGQNLLYIFLMPLRGHGGRYQAVNFLVAGLFLAVGTEPRKNLPKLWCKFQKYGLKIIISLVYLSGVFIWADIYSASVKHVNEVHRAAGEWMKANLPAGTIVAVFDVGAIKYFSGLQVVDIAGLTDNEALKYVLKGNIIPYMREHNAEYIAGVEEYPRGGITPKSEYSLYESDFYDKLGIRQEIGKSLNLIPMKRFAFPMKLWWRPWVTVRTHSPIIMIYKIEWLNPPLLASEQVRK